MIGSGNVLLALAGWLVATSLSAAAPAALRDELRMRALDLVNRERAIHGLGALGLDLPTSLTADQFCEEQLRDGIAGHYTLDGTAPYMRYPWGGSRDMLRENVASWSANYAFETASLPDLIGRSHRTMMDERPPDDGHRRAILDPLATHMGFGVAWRGGELRFAQVFLRRAIDWKSHVPSLLSSGAPAPTIEGRPHPGWKIEGASLHWEPAPNRLTPAEIRSRTDYSLPSTRTDFAAASSTSQSPLVAAAGGLAGPRLETFRDGSFRLQPPLEHGPGVYTAVIWLRHNSSAQPMAAGLLSFRVVE